MKKTEIVVNKPVYLGLSILELSEPFMYQFWYYYVKPKYGEKVYIKTGDIYKHNAENIWYFKIWIRYTFA